jgi:membrane associated rhomboid family serine protease
LAPSNLTPLVLALCGSVYILSQVDFAIAAREEEQKAKEKNQKPRPILPHLILPLLGTATGLFKGELWRLVTSNIVHTNLFHLGKSDDDVDRRLY